MGSNGVCSPFGLRYPSFGKLGQADMSSTRTSSVRHLFETFECRLLANDTARHLRIAYSIQAAKPEQAQTALVKGLFGPG